jgi:hypothetical protein
MIESPSHGVESHGISDENNVGLDTATRLHILTTFHEAEIGKNKARQFAQPS